MSAGLSGFRAWLWQRLTAVYLAAFFIYGLVYLMFAPPAGYSEWQVWVGRPLMLIAIGVFFITLLAHAWVGIRDVIIDYAHPFALRFGILSLAGLFLVGCGVWALKVLIMAGVA